jgi:hypothetical protein
VTSRGKNNINIWLLVNISILIGQLRNIFKSKQPRSTSVFAVPLIVLMKTSSLEHKDPDVFWFRVRLLVEVEFVVFSLSFGLMFMNDNIW